MLLQIARFLRVSRLSQAAFNMAPRKRAPKPASAAAEEPAQQPGDAGKPAKRARKSGSGKDAAAVGEQGTASSAAAAAAAATASAPLGGPSFWLMKSEPDVFSIDDLAAKPDQTEHWDGVRSHQAKKVLQSMRVGDQAFFYHSNAKPPGVVGIVEIVRESYPDHTQLDPSSQYFDPRASLEKQIWCQVDCRLVRKLARQISLEELKRHSATPGNPLASMALVKFGRLSVQPVTAAEWEFVLGLEHQKPAAAAAGAATEAAATAAAAAAATAPAATAAAAAAAGAAGEPCEAAGKTRVNGKGAAEGKVTEGGKGKVKGKAGGGGGKGKKC